ncbi:alpha-ribazole phosphatase [Aquimarina litoralis]|uniref:alpha-ribazole phosphatase n=1 Tax=Aquimarina litoralis TaxID=584605 RepID=UPI001C5906A2|nr:alpha-ribazole phosphatase [Aquimarina litoralis]MBW1298094.1 alpha-ribazole phosphatase [Aquimarina litoralis]
MEIYLVRHTTPDIQKGVCYGQSDLDVANTFETEVAEIHTQVPVKEITKVYSSPLKRCKLLAETFKLPIAFDTRLIELDFGDWELQKWDEISKETLDPWMEDFVNVQVPNGESYIKLQERILDFYNGLQPNSDDKIIIVSHAGPIRALVSYLQNIALKDSFGFKLDYGEVVKI